MMRNNSDSSSKECDWLVEDLPSVKPPLENETKNQQRWKQMPKDNIHSTNTYTATRKDRVTTTTSADNSPKRKKHPPRRVTCTKPSYAATTWKTEDAIMGKCVSLFMV